MTRPSPCASWQVPAAGSSPRQPSRSHLGCQTHQTYCFATWRKKPQPLTGRGKLAERNETSSSALPALQHLLGDLGPNIPWSLCLRFGFCLSKNLLVEAKAPKLLI